MKVCVVIPCYKVKRHILGVIENIGAEVDCIYIVDDFCPEKSGDYVESMCTDSRVIILRNSINMGVGGAVINGYKNALKNGFDIVIKLDGDGQMNPSLIKKLIKPIIEGKADYTKGNRFFSLETLFSMPLLRKLGNSALSFINKASSGYWNVMDPTNGFTAIHRTALLCLPLEKINTRYFFESDMLFRLGTLRAVVKDISMNSLYQEEESNLSIRKVLIDFPPRYVAAFVKRIFYTYFLRDFNGASMELVIGLLLLSFGSTWGAIRWAESIVTDQMASTGTVMLAVLPIILGFQLLLTAISYDMNNIPKTPLQNE